jgi:hypothetical protein
MGCLDPKIEPDPINGNNFVGQDAAARELTNYWIFGLGILEGTEE